MSDLTSLRRLVAGYLNLDPSAEETRPTATIDRLIELREVWGEKAFLQEVRKMMTPPKFGDR